MILVQFIALGVLFAALWVINNRYPKKAFLNLFVFGIITLVNIVLLLQPLLVAPDSIGYWNLSRGNVTEVSQILYRPKFYPLFLSFFTEPIFISLIQTGLKLGIVFIMFLFGRSQKWSRSNLVFVLFLFGINSLFIQEQNRILDTTLFSFLCMLGVYLFNVLIKEFSLLKIIAYCIVTGLCTLTRQIADPFIILSFLVLFFRYKKNIKLIIIGVALFILIGWSGMVINLIKYDIPKRTVALGVNLYTHMAYYELNDPESLEWNALTRAIDDSEIKTYWDTDFRQKINWKANAIPHIYRDSLQAGGMTITQVDHFLTREYLNWIVHNPLRQIKATINEFCRILFVTDEYYPESLLGRFVNLPREVIRLERSLIHIPVWYFLLILPVVMVFQKFSSKLLLYMLSCIVGYLLLISFIHIGFTRYIIPILPLLYFSMGEAIHTLKFRKMETT